MNADQLLALYDRVAEAPDAIARLRRFVLDLAVRGKLVQQDPADEPAILGRSKAITTAPYITPGNWRWICIGDQLDLLNGVAFKPSDWISNGIRIVRIQNLNNPSAPFNHCAPEKARERSLINDGSFLISWSGTPGTSFGAFIWNRGPAVLNQHIFRCDFKTDLFYPQFLQLAINGRLDEMIDKAHGGVGLQHITKGKLEAMLIPLPPLSEQYRIVAKVDELSVLLDRLATTRATREATRDRLTTASLACLTAPDTDTEIFPTHARFALDTLPALTTRAYQIKQLRQTVLNLAVRGKLVEGATGRTEILGNYRKLQNGYAFKSDWFSRSGIRLLRNTNIGHGEIRWNETVYLHEGRAEEFGRFRLNKGDIVLTLDRPFIATGTKVARVENSDLPSLLLQRVGRFVETAPGLSDNYLFLWVNAPHFNEQIDPGRSNGVPHISSKQVEAAEIFVPPLAEQHRIVAKVDELMALLDRLETALTTADTTRARLLESLLHEALAPSTIPKLEAAE